MSSDKFCYTCGEFIVKLITTRPSSKNVKKAYFQYFDGLIGDRDKQRAAHVCCVSCSISLVQRMEGKRKNMPFAVSMVWRGPTNHLDLCYFCLTNTEGYSKKGKEKIDHKNLQSAMRPVPHNADLSWPITPLDRQNVSEDTEDKESSDSTPTLVLFQVQGNATSSALYNKQWAAHVCCVSCSVSLVQWMNGKRKNMPFAVSMVWRGPTYHLDDCYFCLTNTEGNSKKGKEKIRL
nr:unnamed protein product [Callosobruchus analis]